MRVDDVARNICKAGFEMASYDVARNILLARPGGSDSPCLAGACLVWCVAPGSRQHPGADRTFTRGVHGREDGGGDVRFRGQLSSDQGGDRGGDCGGGVLTRTNLPVGIFLNQ
jgi:hypothetical protein